MNKTILLGLALVASVSAANAYHADKYDGQFGMSLEGAYGIATKDAMPNVAGGNLSIFNYIETGSIVHQISLNGGILAGSHHPSVHDLGISGPYWKFLVSKNQQLVLESLAQTTSGSALVCYACAAFDRVSELWAHSRTGSIVAASTFPTAASLRGHEAWYYTSAGCSGVANPTHERIEEVSLHEKISRLASQRAEAQHHSDDFQQNLEQLAKAIYNSLNEEAVGNSGRTAAYFESLREIDQYISAAQMPRQAEAVRSYLAVAVFASIFGLQWYTISP